MGEIWRGAELLIYNGEIFSAANLPLKLPNILQELSESQAPGLRPERRAPPHRRHPPACAPLVRAVACQPARRAGRPSNCPGHRLRLPHRQPLVYRGEIKGVPLAKPLKGPRMGLPTAFLSRGRPLKGPLFYALVFLLPVNGSTNSLRLSWSAI